MIVTMKELEKGIWCPHVRARAIGGSRDQVANRVIDGKEIKADGKKIFCCIGPACMAWRWVEKGASGFCGCAGVPIDSRTMSFGNIISSDVGTTSDTGPAKKK